LDEFLAHRMKCAKFADSSENSSVGRAQPCQGWGREFESRFSLNKSLPFRGAFFVFTDNFGELNQDGNGVLATNDIPDLRGHIMSNYEPIMGKKKGGRSPLSKLR
jgi:hypothetical protein